MKIELAKDAIQPAGPAKVSKSHKPIHSKKTWTLNFPNSIYPCHQLRGLPKVSTQMAGSCAVAPPKTINRADNFVTMYN